MTARLAAWILLAAGLACAPAWGQGAAPGAREPAIVIEGPAVPKPLPPDPQQLPPPPPGGSVIDALSGRDLYHGNYCGYGNRGEGQPPVDLLDEACRVHDACYDQVGRNACSCDAVLRRDAARLADEDTLSPGVRARAATIASAFELASCVRQSAGAPAR